MSTFIITYDFVETNFYLKRRQNIYLSSTHTDVYFESFTNTFCLFWQNQALVFCVFAVPNIITELYVLYIEVDQLWHNQTCVAIYTCILIKPKMWFTIVFNLVRLCRLKSITHNIISLRFIYFINYYQISWSPYNSPFWGKVLVLHVCYIIQYI